MAALTAVVVALSIAVAANFALLLGVIRRMRLQRPATTPPSLSLPGIGMQAPAFAAQDAEGQEVDDAFYAVHEESVLAFVSDHCEPCDRLKNELAREPLDVPVLAFVQTVQGGARQVEFAAELARTGAQTVLLEPGSELPKRFAITGYPTLVLVRSGIVATASIKLADVRKDLNAGSSRRRRLGVGRSNGTATVDRVGR